MEKRATRIAETIRPMDEEQGGADGVEPALEGVGQEVADHAAAADDGLAEPVDLVEFQGDQAGQGGDQAEKGQQLVETRMQVAELEQAPGGIQAGHRDQQRRQAEDLEEEIGDIGADPAADVVNDRSVRGCC